MPSSTILCGIILFIALFGAISLVLRDDRSIKYYNINKQCSLRNYTKKYK